MKTALPHRFLIACLILLIGLFLQACSTQPEHDRLHTMMDEAEEYQSDQNPYNDDADSDRTDAGLWSDSNDDFEQEYTFWTYMSHRLSEQVNSENFDIRDQITYDSFLRQITHRVKEFEYQSHLIPINHEGGFYNRLTGLENRGSFEAVEDYVSYLERLLSVPDYFNDNIERTRRGLEIGYTLPRAIFVDDYTYYISTHIKENPTGNDLYSPFENFPDDISDTERTRLSEEAESVINSTVMPAYRNFVQFLVQEYIPASRESIATVDLPEGEAYYNYLIEYHTTLPMTDSKHNVFSSYFWTVTPQKRD